MITTCDVLDIDEWDEFEGGTLVYVPVSEMSFGNIFDYDLESIVRQLSVKGWHTFDCSQQTTSDFVEFFLEDILCMSESDFMWEEETTPEEKLEEMWERENEILDSKTDECLLQVHRIVLHGYDIKNINLPKKVSDSIILCILEPAEFNIDAKQIYVIA